MVNEYNFHKIMDELNYYLRYYLILDPMKNKFKLKRLNKQVLSGKKILSF